MLQEPFISDQDIIPFHMFIKVVSRSQLKPQIFIQLSIFSSIFVLSFENPLWRTLFSAWSTNTKASSRI